MSNRYSGTRSRQAALEPLPRDSKVEHVSLDAAGTVVRCFAATASVRWAATGITTVVQRSALRRLPDDAVLPDLRPEFR